MNIVLIRILCLVCVYYCTSVCLSICFAQSHRQRTLYWTDRQKIFRANLDGSSITPIVDSDLNLPGTLSSALSMSCVTAQHTLY